MNNVAHFALSRIYVKYAQEYAMDDSNTIAQESIYHTLFNPYYWSKGTDITSMELVELEYSKSMLEEI